ncbi:MarR family transcriptional regulator [Gemmobacter aquarius]|uniref:MarR family transcriptional regulator n=1 Tax=Paragemmobacter aquarius TaxID=2169400 RepID=A0A2S0UQJ8_9RHOB|nr:MarR family transcriptional regulator [Gemmobacter aquarius]AWB50085.1 MarR family transcriptional regulator [Gemmobacter aquarius]
MTERPASERNEDIAVALFGELFMADQLARNRISKVLPKGMELSHFGVLNHLARVGDERSPAQLARAFHVTRGAMTNTLTRLEWAGHVHIRPDWDDARRKFVAISPSGRAARDAAVQAVAPLIAEVVQALGADRVRALIPVLREMRTRLEDDG